MKTNLFVTAALSLSLFTASTAQTLPAYLPADGLVGWWPFNGNLNDESGNNLHGQFAIPEPLLPPVTLTQDRFSVNNAALSFPGAGMGVALPPPISGTFSDELSYSLWFKQDFVNDFICLLDATYSGRICLIAPNSSSIRAYNGSSFYLQANHPDLNTNTWKHLVVSYSQGIINIYLNNDLIGTIPTGTPFTFPDGQTLLGLYSGTIYSYMGLLDDIAIYNRALTPEEITALYTGEPVNPPTTCNTLPSNLQNGLVGYWPFCGNANDESGNGNDGTVNGATLTEDRFGVANAAYGFDGESTFINVGNDLQFSELTYNAWMRPTAFANSNEEGYVIISNLHNIEPYYGNNSELYYSVNGSIVAGLSGGIWEFTNDAFYADTNIWTMVTLTYSENVLKLYKNGSMEFEQPWGDFVLDTVDTYIGARPNNIGVSPWAVFNGSLDDIGIWNRALTPEEVQQLYTLNACTFTIYDTVTIENVVTVYDTVLTTVTDTLIINTLITELAPPANTNTIKVFPNPAGSTLTIDYGNFALMNGYQLRIDNSLGQEVFQTNISQQSDTLSLGTWGGNGLYFVHIVDPQGNTIDIRKIVLQ